MISKINQDHILQSFYQERKSRGKAPKRHSLLQKNLSYFANSAEDKQNSQVHMKSALSSSKCVNRKKKLEQYEQNLREFTKNLQSMQKKSQPSQLSSSHKNQFFQDQVIDKNYPFAHQKQRYTELMSPEFKKQQQQKVEEAEYSSPKFNTNHNQMLYQQLRHQRQRFEEGDSQQREERSVQQSHNRNQSHRGYDEDSSNKQQDEFKKTWKNEEKNREIQFLKERVEALQKINKKQSKFIESVQKMKKTIDKSGTDCSLKDLWRWLKTLPNYSNIQ